MLKKLIKMGVVMSVMLASVNAFAQNTGKPEYPRYGFWSNWSIGGAIDLNDQAAMGGFSFGDNWRKSTNIGLEIFAQQKLNHAFDWRIRFAFPNLWAPLTGTANDGNNYKMDRHATLTLDILFSLNNAIKGYDPDRRFNFYIYAGGGLGLSFNPDAPTPSTFFSKDLHHTNRIFRIGYYYCFGLTATDKAVAAQKAMLTQENFSALNSQVNNLERQVNTSRGNEKKLENRIAELEDQLAQALEQGKGGNSAAADSLQAVIDQIKADQLNFYAMPFSVLYGVDQWRVPEE